MSGRDDLNRQEYIVQFFYYSDLRTDAKVYAYNEISALAMALEQIGEADWVNDKGFRIVIKMEE